MPRISPIQPSHRPIITHCLGSRAPLAVTTLAAQQNRRDVSLLPTGRISDQVGRLKCDREATTVRHVT